VIRFPNDYFGKLAITGAPAFRRQDANDFIMGDYALDKGYPFAAGPAGYRSLEVPSDVVAHHPLRPCRHPASA
jgi:hypothetical protein